MLTVLSCGACCRITSAPSPFALALPLVAASCPARKATAARAVAIVVQIGFMFDVLSFFRYDRRAILNMKHHEGQRLTRHPYRRFPRSCRGLASSANCTEV